MSEGIGSQPEESQALPVPESKREANRCLFISGALATTAGIAGIKESLRTEYGIENVEAFGSIFCSDPQNPRRFEQMADYIQSNSKDGLHVVAYSLGSSELLQAIKLIVKKDPNFFEKNENTKNLHISLVSPSGFNKGVIGGLRYFGRVLKFVRNEGGREVPPGIFKPKAPHLGINALTAFPLAGIEPEELNEALRLAMPKLSQGIDREGIEKVPLEKGQRYLDKLTDEEKKTVKLYSEMFRSAIDNRNYKAVANLVERYGEVFQNPLWKVFGGDFESTKTPMIEQTKSIVGGYIGLLRTLRTLVDAFGSAPMKELAKLKEKGVKMDFVIPEYDIYMKLDQAIKFFEGPEKSSNNIRMIEGAAHSYGAPSREQFAGTVRPSSDNSTAG